MNRHALILEELQLAPLWVRRDLLQKLEALPSTELPTPQLQPELVPGEEPHARHPLPAVARAANKVLAPLISPSEILRAHHPVAAAPEVSSAPQDNPRSMSIAQMDWQALQDAVTHCTACALCASRKQTIFGSGGTHAELVIIGEAPDDEEDQLGEPFTGQAGKLLDNMLKAIGEQRGGRTYITNVVKCRPPNNRTPSPDEVALCAPFLQRQINLIRPKALLATGRFSAHSLLATNAPLSALRDKQWQWQNIPLLATYHPTYLLRNLSDKSKSWDDLLRIREILNVSRHIQADKKD